MAIQHIVQFAYKPGTTAEQRAEIGNAFLNLKSGCVRGDSEEPYITSLVGGANNSPEGLADGLDHAYIVTFKNADDRDYYVFHDRAHERFKALAGPHILKPVVVDFEEGKF